MTVVSLIKETNKLNQIDLLTWYKSVEKKILKALDHESEKEAVMDLKNGNIYKASSGSELIDICLK